MPYEDDTQRPQEECKMKEKRERQNDQEEINDQFNQEDKKKEETSLTEAGNDPGASTSDQLDLGGPSQENEESKKIGNQRNRAEILKLRETFGDVFGSTIRKTDNPKLFSNTKVITEDNITTLYYKNERIAEQRGSGKWRSSKGKSNAQKKIITEFKNEFKKAQEKYDKTIPGTIESEAKLILEEDEIKSVLNDALDDVERAVDRNVSIVQIDVANKIYYDAETISREERDFKTKRKDISDKVDELDRRMEKYEEDGEKDLAEKYKQMSDKIRTRLLNEKPKYYKTGKAVKWYSNENIAVKLKEIRKWLKKRFPIIVGVVSFAAGVFSIVFTVIKLTSGAVKKAAETTHSIGKTIARILAKFGPLMVSVGSFIISLMSFLAQGMMWVANNLWILFVALIGYLWNKYGRKTTR